MVLASLELFAGNSGAQPRRFPASVYVVHGHFGGHGNGIVDQYVDGTNGLLSPFFRPSINAGKHPSSITIAPNGKYAYVTSSDFIGDGIFEYDINPVTGRLSHSPVRFVSTGVGADGLVVSPGGTSAYVSLDNGEASPSGGVDQFDVNLVTGALSPKDPLSIPAPLNAFPRGIAISPDGRSVYVANWTANTVSQYDVDPVTGNLSSKLPATVPTGSFDALGIVVSSNGRNVYVANFTGDTVSQFGIDPTDGTLFGQAQPIATGSVPVGIIVSPDGRYAYVTNTLGNTVSQYDVDSGGTLSPMNPATITTANGPDGIAESSNGSNVYVADYNASVISQYSVDPATGALQSTTPAVVSTAPLPFAIAVRNPS